MNDCQQAKQNKRACQVNLIMAKSLVIPDWAKFQLVCIVYGDKMGVYHHIYHHGLKWMFNVQ
jgi:hypothetical protein